MTIKEARIFDVKSMSDQSSLGLRVLVMRHWPRGFARTHVDIWLPDAGPSDGLLTAYRDGDLSWLSFSIRYQAEQHAQQKCRVVRYDNGGKLSDIVFPVPPLAFLHEVEEGYGLVTVMCWEDTDCECHRFLLVEALT